MATSHAPRGGLRRDTLEALLAERATLREMAARVDRSPTTVRHWLRVYGLRVERRRGRRPRNIVDVRENGLLVAVCPAHGETDHDVDGRGHVRCLACRAAAVVRRRRKVKEILVAEAGGCCVLCGYDRHPGVLQFHHVDPAQKAFSVSRDGVTRSLAKARAEARKCTLLCANCHAEVELGVQALPLHQPPGLRGSHDPG
jgi:hypothetical protein